MNNPTTTQVTHKRSPNEKSWPTHVLTGTIHTWPVLAEQQQQQEEGEREDDGLEELGTDNKGVETDKGGGCRERVNIA